VLSSHSGGGRTGGDCGAARWAVFGVQLALVLALTAGAGFLTTLWALGPPTYNRRDKTARAQAVHVDWLHADDLGDGADARTIVARHGRIGLCHCPGEPKLLSGSACGVQLNVVQLQASGRARAEPRSPSFAASDSVGGFASGGFLTGARC
jgi:hypothetical protein